MKIKRTTPAMNVQHTFALATKNLVRAYFGEKSLTCIGGAVLLLEMELTYKIVCGAAACLRDWRSPSHISYSLLQILWQRVLLICCGFEDAVDVETMADDEGFRLSLAIEGNTKFSTESVSDSTMVRFENGFGARNCYRLAMWMVLSYIQSKKRIPKSIRLDFDGSSIEAFGRQEGTSYRKHYNCNMFFPLLVFDEDGVLITAVLRPGWFGEVRMTLPILSRLVRHFRQAWGNVEITVVMDAAFTSQEIYDWCEAQGAEDPERTVYYLIKLKNAGGEGSGLFTHSKDTAKLAKESFSRRFGVAKYAKEKGKRRPTKNTILKEIKAIEDKNTRNEKLTELEGRVTHRYVEFTYQAGMGGKDKKQWKLPRRIVGSCTFDDWGGRRTFWVTNLKGGTAEDLILRTYSRRANAELRIKDAKAFRMDKLSCTNFVANQTRLLIHVLAQRLLNEFRNLLPISARTKSLLTIKEEFIRIPGILNKRARDTEVIWSSTYPAKHLMHIVCRKLVEAKQTFFNPRKMLAEFLEPILRPPLRAA